MPRFLERNAIGRGIGDLTLFASHICGICSNSQEEAAVLAQESAAGVTPTPNGVRLRNLVVLGEAAADYVLHGIGMLLVELCDPEWKHLPFHPEIVEALTPMTGRYAREAFDWVGKLRVMSKTFERIWPHSTFMRLGGVAVRNITLEQLNEAERAITSAFGWYATNILGIRDGNIEEWLEKVQSWEELQAWVEERPHSALGILVRFSQATGLDMGRGAYPLLSYGSRHNPEKPSEPLYPGGVLVGGKIHPLDQREIREHRRFTRYQDPGPTHPWDTFIEPIREEELDDHPERYTWVIAPRYKGSPGEMGTLADLAIGGDLLAQDLARRFGPTTLTRQVARFHGVVIKLYRALDMLRELRDHRTEPALEVPTRIEDGDGVGLTDASRGGLGDWIKVRDGKTTACSIIPPTTWNASGRCTEGIPGPWEDTLTGMEVSGPKDPRIRMVAIGCNACLNCAVHAYEGDVKHIIEIGHQH